MNGLLWEIIEKTKNGKVFEKSENQYNTLEELLLSLDDETIKELQEQWDHEVSTILGDEFDQLHWSRGGIVNAGDDGFYMDFANWLIAQGKELVEQFKKQGHRAVLDYIYTQKIEEEDYLFECMIYAFHRRLENA